MLTHDATVRFATEFTLGEGPRWFGQRLWVVDIPNGRLYRTTPDLTDLEPVLATEGLPLGGVAPIRGRAGKLIAAVGDGVAVLAPTVDGRASLHWLHRIPDPQGRELRVNDAVADPAGRFWFTTMAVSAEHGAGALWRVDRDGSLHRVVGHLTIPNGPAFSGDGRTMLLADSQSPRLRRFTLDEAGDPIDGVDFGDMDARTPDGMVFDREDAVWIALWDEGLVQRLDLDARVLEQVRVPAPLSTAPALGGEDLQTLFITTARAGLASPTAADGAVYAARVSVPGLPAAEYRPLAAAEAAHC